MQQMIDDRKQTLYPENTPSLFAGLGQLPRLYLKVITRPFVKTLSDEVRWARWSIVVLQFLLLVGITAVLNLLGQHISTAALHTVAAFRFDSFEIFGWLPAPFNGIVFILATFLIGLGTAYPFSKLSRGQGRLVEHTFILLLVTIPLVTISGALLLIPATGSLAMMLTLVVGVLFLYRMVLHVVTIRAVHRLPTGNAVLIVLIIPILLLIIGLIVFADGLDVPNLPSDFSGRKKKPAK